MKMVNCLRINPDQVESGILLVVVKRFQVVSFLRLKFLIPNLYLSLHQLWKQRVTELS